MQSRCCSGLQGSPWAPMRCSGSSVTTLLAMIRASTQIAPLGGSMLFSWYVSSFGNYDIAPQYLAEMQRRAEGQRRQPLPLRRRIKMSHAGAGGGDRAQRRMASARRTGDRENRHTPSPMNFSISPRTRAPPRRRGRTRRQQDVASFGCTVLAGKCGDTAAFHLCLSQQHGAAPRRRTAYAHRLG